MLRSNIRVFVLIFIFGLDFVNSSPHHDAVLHKYRKKLQYSLNGNYALYQPKTNYDIICNKPKEERAAICKSIIKRLRSSSSNVYKNMHMNYLAYNNRKPCTYGRIWINKGDILAHQTLLNCFAGSMVISPESSEEMVHFYGKIVLYPLNSEYMLVFEYNEDEKYYILLGEYYMKWNDVPLPPVSIFSTPMPQSWSEISTLYNILYPKHSKLHDYSENSRNVVNSLSNKNYVRMCNWAFRTDNDKTVVNYYADFKKKPQPDQLEAILRGPIQSHYLLVSIIAYTCKNAVGEDKEAMSKKYISAGPGDYSVILLKEVDHSKNDTLHYEIIEFIEYVTEDYIYLYYQNLY